MAGLRAQIVGYDITTTDVAASDVEQFTRLSLTVQVKPNRFYFFVSWGFQPQTTPGDNLLMRLRHTTDGTAVTLTSPVLKERMFWPTRSSLASDREFFHLYESPATEITLKARATIEPVNGATGGKTFNGRTGVMILIDLGPSFAATP